MKNKRSINIRVALFCLFFVFLGCSKPKTNPTSPLSGSWNLVKIVPEIVSASQFFEPGKIVWNINFETQKIIVENKVANTNLNSGLLSDNYSFVSPNMTSSFSCQSIDIESIGNACWEINGNQLIIATSYRDGPDYFFER